MTLQHRMKKPKFKIHLTFRRNTVFNYLVNISLNKIKLIINNDEILIHSRSSQPNFLWTIEVGRGEVGGGGRVLATKGLFLLPKGKGVSLSPWIVFNFESADKDEFVSCAGRKKNGPSINNITKLQATMWQIKAKSSHIWSTQVTYLS